MILVAPRSAKLVGARGARFTLLTGYVSLLLAFGWMLLLWNDDSHYWQIGVAYMLIGTGVGFAGTPASHSLTGSVPVQRAGMASGTADLQRDLGGAILQSLFGALLTRAAVPAVLERDRRRGEVVVPVRCRLGVHRGHRRDPDRAVIVFVLFPGKESEERLLAAYQTEDTGR